MQQLELAEFSSIDCHDCPDCQESFDSEMGLKVHHGKVHDGRLASPTVECANCGTKKTTANYRKRTHDHHFCGHECKGEWQSENLVGEDHPRWDRETAVCEVCASEYTVIQHDVETTRYCSQECHLHALAEQASKRTGSDHPTWKGGTSTYIAIRRCLGERGWQYIADEYRKETGHTCEWCGAPPQDDRALDVHHIVPICSGGTHHKDNLMALCRPCHSTVERYTDDLFSEVLVDEFGTEPLRGGAGES